jgi:hypothetical protein
MNFRGVDAFSDQLATSGSNAAIGLAGTDRRRGPATLEHQPPGRCSPAASERG